MNNFTITLDGRQLLAALLFAGKQELRYYLNGVHVEATQSQTRLHSTNGHAASLQRLAAVNSMGGETARQFIIPRDVLDKAKPALKKAKAVTIETNESAYALKIDGVSHPFVPIDGCFPNLRAIVPQTTFSGEAAQFNPEFVDRCGKAAKLLGYKYGCVHIRHNGQANAALVTIPNADNFVAVLLPLRIKPADLLDAGWAAAT